MPKKPAQWVTEATDPAVAGAAIGHNAPQRGAAGGRPANADFRGG
jgi:hypothetical protein